MSTHRLIALLAFVSTSLPLAAEPGVVVSLASIGDRVRAQNPDLAAARLRIREALGRMNQSGRLANPELEAGFEHDPRMRQRSLEIGFTQRFPVTGRLALEKKVTLTEYQASEAEVREVERRIIAEAREAVVNVLAIRQRRDLLGEQAGLAGEFAGVLAAAAEKGEGSALDAGQAKLEAAGLAVEIRQLDAAETVAVGTLKPLLGIRPGEPLHVGGTLPEPALPKAGVDPARRPAVPKLPQPSRPATCSSRRAAGSNPIRCRSKRPPWSTGSSMPSTCSKASRSRRAIRWRPWSMPTRGSPSPPPSRSIA